MVIIEPSEAPTAPVPLVFERTVQIPIPEPEQPKYKPLCRPQCVEFVRSKIPSLPIMRTPADIQPNSKPQKGCAVLLDYNHIGYIPLITSEGIFVQHTNSDFNCGYREDFYPWGSKHIRGFWCP